MKKRKKGFSLSVYRKNSLHLLSSLKACTLDGTGWGRTGRELQSGNRFLSSSLTNVRALVISNCVPREIVEFPSLEIFKS